MSFQTIESQGTPLEALTFRSSDISPRALRDWRTRRGIRPDHEFLLLLGPSAVGKTEIIAQLDHLAKDHYSYVKPYMTRPLREGETNKNSVSNDVFTTMEKNGEFICVNNLYEYRYGTPVAPILEAQRAGKIPILDFPLDQIHKLDSPLFDLVKIYVLPASVKNWLEFLQKTGRANNSRYQAGISELADQVSGGFHHPDVDFYIVNAPQKSREAAQNVNTVMESINNPAVES